MKLLRISIIATLVVGLLLAAAMPIMAAPEASAPAKAQVQLDNGAKSPFGWLKNRLQKNRIVQGVVASVDTTNNKIALESDKVIYVNSETKYHIPTLGNSAGLADIDAGMRIVALVYENDGKTYARQISTVPGRPVYKHHVGEVTAYTAGNSVTIKSKDGDSTTFDIADDCKILPKDATVAVGKQVTIISRRDPSSTEFVATGIVVHPEKNQEENNHPYLWHFLEAVRNAKKVSGNIVSISDTFITIDPTPGGASDDNIALTRDSSTVIVLRGTTGLVAGQSAVVFYTEVGTAKLAKVVVVGISLAEIAGQTT